jgi:hypothetical protein
LELNCIDATHNVGNGFKLITVLTVNEFFQGTPLAFCISKRENGSVLATFFESIKKRVNKPLISKVFMSDDAEFFFKTWKATMDPENLHYIQRLLCTWHVNRAWKTNIQSRVKEKFKRAELSVKLFDLRKELDQQSFEQKLNEFKDSYENDPTTSEFWHYFNKNYLNRVE